MKVVDEYDVGIKLHNVPIDLDAGQANELLRTLSKIRATVSSISSAAWKCRRRRELYFLHLLQFPIPHQTCMIQICW